MRKSTRGKVHDQSISVQNDKKGAHKRPLYWDLEENEDLEDLSQSSMSNGRPHIHHKSSKPKKDE